MKHLNIYVCSNNTCTNTRIFYNRDNPICDFCEEKMSSFQVESVLQEDRDLADKELSLRSSRLSWLGKKQLDCWPGPLAFEYIRLKDIMLAGNIEGACWKIANLAEVITTYFFSAALEQGLRTNLNQIPFIGKKISDVKDFYNCVYIQEIMHDLKLVVDWRNKFGVGHGSLSRNRELFIEKLLSFCGILNKSLNDLNKALQFNNLKLIDQAGNEIVGQDYIYQISTTDWGQILTCSLDKSVNLPFNLICLQGYQFSGPDIYFFDHKYSRGKKRIIQYKNYTQNRMKYLNGSNSNSDLIVWSQDPWQVAWLNPNERVAWFNYFRDSINELHCSDINKEILVDAIAQFQKRGMHDKANDCYKLYDEYREQKKATEKESLSFKLLMAKYIQSASLGDRNQAAKKLKEIDSLIDKIQSLEQKKKYRIRADIDICWYEGVYGNFKRAFDTCLKTLEVVLNEKKDYPLSASLDELELRKNEIYFSYRYRNEVSIDNLDLMKKSQELIFLASKIYNFDPENNRIIDVLGFACNLYGDLYMDYHQKADDKDSTIVRSIYSLNQYGVKIRRHLFNMFPDDIWAIRGYAWSIQINGVLESRLFNNKAKAESCFTEAESIWLNGERKYPEDLGLKEDLLQSYIQYRRLIGLNKDNINHEKNAIARLETIEDQEGSSPRVIKFKEELEKLRELV